MFLVKARKTMIHILVFLFSITLSSAVYCDQITYLIVDDIAKPFQITEEHISKGGIISDIIDAIFKGSEHTVKVQVLPVKRLYKMVETNAVSDWIAYDARVWNSLSEWGDFVEEPLFSVNHAYLTCHQNMSQQINSADHIKSHNIAIIENFKYPELTLLQENKTIKLHPVKNYQQGIHLAGLNRVDGFVEMELRLRYNLQQEVVSKPCLRFVDMSQIIPAYPIYLSYDSQDKKGIKEFVNKRIKALKKAGVIDSILNAYTGVEKTSVVQNERYK